MKKIVKIFAACLLLIPLSGCNKAMNTSKTNSNQGTSNTVKVTKPEKGDGSGFMRLTELSEEQKKVIEESKADRSYRLMDGGNVIAVFMGKQNSGGSSIKIENIEIKGKTAIIKIKETFPNAKDNNIQAITYPYDIARAPMNLNNLELKFEGATGFVESGLLR